MTSCIIWDRVRIERICNVSGPVRKDLREAFDVNAKAHDNLGKKIEIECVD